MISGQNLIGGDGEAGGGEAFHAVNPATGERLEPAFHEATSTEVERAASAAEAAFRAYRRIPPAARAAFLRRIAEELLALGPALIERAHVETALPPGRLEGERTRTVNQLRLFAGVLDEGSWVDARIDPGDPARTPAPRPDLRRMLIPMGPVAVFGASNFPLAFSVAGGDTASALAAGCTVVCKAHPAHPGTSELVARAIAAAAAATGMPAGVISLLHGWSNDVGLALVRHPLIAAVGFTGSLRGGRALFDAAAARPSPIPVYAEMGSINPVFLLPGAVRERADEIGAALAASITLGVGQFCTNPRVVLGVAGLELDRVRARLARELAGAGEGVMLYDRLAGAHADAVARARAHGARPLGPAGEVATSDAGAPGNAQPAAVAGDAASPARARPIMLAADFDAFMTDGVLREEVFGPASLLVSAADQGELLRAAAALEGQLTASVFGSPEDLRTHAALLEILERKVGRIIFNGVPTGVEVGHAMQHGGPYPATTDARSTSVGSAAIARFARPVCFQDFPADALPPALRDRNALGIWRRINGELTRDDVV